MLLICQLCDTAVSSIDLSGCSKEPELYSYTSCICGCMLCVQCYEKYEGKTSTCPSCRRHINPPSNRQNNSWCAVMKYCMSIPTSLSLTTKGSIHDLLNQLLSRKSDKEIVSKVTECSECIKEPAVLKCLQCNVCLCSACFTTVHKNSRVLQRHSRVSMSFSNSESICREHDKLKEMFCHDDGMNVCPDCVENWHSTHQVVHLKEKTDEIVDSIRDDYEKTEVVRNLIRQQVTEIEKEGEVLMTECRKNSYLAFTTFCKSIAAVQLSYQQFLSDLESSVHEKLETLLQLKEKAMNDLTSLNTVLNQASPILKSDNRPLLNPMFLSDRLKKAQRSLGVFERVSESLPDPVEDDGVRISIKFSSDVWKIRFADITGSFSYKLRNYDEARLSDVLSSALEGEGPISSQPAEKKSKQDTAVRKSLGGGVYDCEEVVTISSVKNPLQFYVQRANHPNKSSVTTALKPQNNQQLRTVCKGVMYAAVRLVDGTGDQLCWSRAIVTKIIDGENDSSRFESADKNNNFGKIMVEVLFVDCGSSARCLVSLLRDLRPNDSEIPYLARCCSLIGVAPPDGELEWSDKTVADFNKLLRSSAPIYMRVISREANSGKLFVDLMRKPGEPVISKITPESIRDMLLFHRVVSEKEDEFLSMVKSKTSKSFRKYLPPVALKTNSKRTAILSHFSSPQCFVVQLIGRYSERLTELSEKINQFIGLSTTKSAYKMILPRPGMPCLAVYYPCMLWFRAKIISFDKEAQKVNVLYVDYGNESVVKVDECLLIPDQFMKLPYTTFQCRLNNIQPPKDEDWCKEARNRFMELCENKTFVMYIYEVFDNNEYSVDLFDVADSHMQACELLSVGERLINEGLAVTSTSIKTPTTSSSVTNHDVYRAKRKSFTKQVKPENVSVINAVKKVQSPSIEEVDLVKKVESLGTNETDPARKVPSITEVDSVEEVHTSSIKEVDPVEKVKSASTTEIDSVKKVDFSNIKEVDSVKEVESLSTTDFDSAKKVDFSNIEEVDLVKKVESSSTTEVDSAEKIDLSSINKADSVKKVQSPSIEVDSAKKAESECTSQNGNEVEEFEVQEVETLLEVPQSAIQLSSTSNDHMNLKEDQTATTQRAQERPQSSSGKTSIIGSSVHDTMDRLLITVDTEEEVSQQDGSLQSSRTVSVATPCDDCSDDLEMFTPEEFVVNGYPYVVRVTKVETPSSFYIQTNEQWKMCNEAIRPLHELIKGEEQTTTARHFNKLLRPSTLVACKSEKEKRWCRGKVISQKEDGFVTIRLIDTGVLEDLLPQFMRELPPQFRLLPPFATRCRLSSVIPAGDVTKWTKCAQDTFKSLIEESSNKKIVVTEMPEFDWMPLPVKLYLDGDDDDREAGRLLHLTGVAMKPPVAMTTGGNKINEQFRKLMQDYVQADREFQMNYDRDTSETPPPSSELLPQDGADECSVVAVSEESSLSVHSEGEELRLSVIPFNPDSPDKELSDDKGSEEDDDDDETEGFPPAIPFEVGSRFACIVAHVVRSDMMYILPDDSPNIPPDDFDHSSLPKLERIKPRMPCLAPYSRDGKFYRALIYEVVDDVQAKVFFVDYGLDETVDVSTLLRLPKEFLAPMQAVLCHVPSVRTVIDDYACPERIALEEVAEVLAGADVDCFVEKDEDDLLHIQLFLKQVVDDRQHIREVADQFEDVLAIKY